MPLNTKPLRYIPASLLVAVLCAGSPLCAQQIVADKIIARVDNYIVLKSDLELAYQTYLASGNPPSDQSKCNMLNRLVLEKVMVARANLDSVTVSDAEVEANTDSRIQMILQNSGNLPEELEQAYGKTMHEIKLDLRERIREQMLSNRMVTNIAGDISATPDEVRRFFKKIPPDSLPFYSSSVEVSQIVKIPQINKEQKEKTRQLLMQLRDRALQGEPFTTLAKQYSQDPSVGQNGGEMGYVARGAMVSEYEASAFRLKEGEISMPFESPYGFHIMQLIDRRGAEYDSRHILIAATPSEADMARSIAYLDSLRTAIIEKNTPFAMAARTLSDDKATRGQGGFITSAEGDFEISTKDIDPATYFALDTMKVGSISRTMVYQMRDGKNAARILYFKNKTPPHKASLQYDWRRIQSAAIAEKKDVALDKWFIKARKDIFIRVAPEYESCHIAG